jgi:hypothetical protein
MYVVLWPDGRRVWFGGLVRERRIVIEGVSAWLLLRMWSGGLGGVGVRVWGKWREGLWWMSLEGKGDCRVWACCGHCYVLKAVWNSWVRSCLFEREIESVSGVLVLRLSSSYLDSS